jgi:hypothetical protein
MRFPLAVSAIAVVAIAVAACTGSPPSTFVTPPVTSAASTGAVTLSGGAATQSAGTAGGVTGILTYAGGSGTVTAASSASAPAGTTAVTPQSGLRVEATSPPTSPNIYYVTISTTTGATLPALPAVNLTLSTPSVGTYQEAQFLNGKWSNIAVSASNTANGQGATSVSFPPGKSLTLAPGASIFLAFYQGSFPGPTPPGSVVNTALADPGFEGTAAVLGSAVTKTGWTVCTITAAGTGATFPGNRPVSNFTPVPGSTPAAVILAAGTSVPQGTGTPKPTQNTVPVENGNQAAVFGGVFNNFNAADYAYNGLCQMVTIPANPLGSVAVFANGTENNTAFLGFQVNILDTTGKFLANVVDENQIQTTPPGDQNYRPVPLLNSALSPFAGQTVELFVGIWTKAGSSTGSTVFSGYYFVDDIAIAAGS